MDNIAYKIQGCIWGSLVGDALGTRYEFLSSDDATEQYNNDLNNARDGNKILPMLGGGPFDLAPGQITDDGELTVSLLDGIISGNGLYNPNIVAQKYVDWFNSDPFDIGKTTSNAFSLSQNVQRSIYMMVRNNSVSHNLDSQSNGCLMRASPLGIVAYLYPDSTSKLALYDCQLTNPNINCVNAVEIYITTIAMLLGNNTSNDIYTRIMSISNDINKQIIKDSTKTWRVRDKGNKTFLPDGKSMGYYGIALQNALYHLFKGSSYREAMESTIKLGGDTDTNCCILGGILGSKYGINKIPTEWLNKVKGLYDPEYNRYAKLPIIEPSKINNNINKLLAKI